MGKKWTLNPQTLKFDRMGVSLDDLYAIFQPILPTTPDNPTTKYLNGLLQWAEIVLGSGGYAANLYFTTVNSDISGYKKISYTNDAATTELVFNITSGTTLLRTYLYDNAIGVSTINDGVWRFKYSVKVNNTSGVTKMMVVPFVRHTDGTETDLFTAYTPEINNTDYLDALIDFSQPAFSITSTDRLGVRVYGYTTSGATITLSSRVGDGNAAYFNTPLSPRHSQLRDLNGDSAYQHITATDRTNLNNLSGTNTGDQTLPSQRAFSFTIDGGGIVPSTSEIGTAVAGCAGTITGWRAQEISTEAGVSSSASWVVKKNGTAISGTEKPSLSSQTDHSDTSLSTWTTGFSKGDRFDLVPESYTTGTKYLVTIYYTASS